MGRGQDDQVEFAPADSRPGAGKEVDAFGDAANIAARVQAAADPSTLMVSDATQRLVSGLFVVEDRGAQTLKGIARPVRLYRVIRPSGMRGRPRSSFPRARCRAISTAWL